MSIKTKLAVTGAGLFALGGSALGLSLASTTASAAPTGTSSIPQSAAESTTPGDPGPAIQSGDQTGPDRTATDKADSVASDPADTSAETDAPENGAAFDGMGGHQDPAGNVDHQSTTEQ
jgi:hypothetical protein